MRTNILSPIHQRPKNVNRPRCESEIQCARAIAMYMYILYYHSHVRTCLRNKRRKKKQRRVNSASAIRKSIPLSLSLFACFRDARDGNRQKKNIYAPQYMLGRIVRRHFFFYEMYDGERKKKDFSRGSFLFFCLSSVNDRWSTSNFFFFIYDESFWR